MKHRLFIALVALFWSCAGYATNYYVRDCGAGSSSTCAPNPNGDTYDLAKAAQGYPIKSCARVKALLFATPTTLAAGDQILFAKGGAWDACSMMGLFNTNARAASRITFGTYTPPGETAAPLLNGTTAHTLQLLNSGLSLHDEGYAVVGLHFKGDGVSGTSAITFGGDVDFVTIERVEVEQHAIGIQCSAQNTNGAGQGSNGLNEHIVVRDSNIHHNRAIGYLGGCDYQLVEGTTFTANGQTVRDHQIYFDGSFVGTTNHQSLHGVVRRNTFTDSSYYGTGRCNAAAVIAHGYKRGLLIEFNTFTENSVATDGNCFGIAVAGGDYSGTESVEGFEDVTIRGNRIKNFAKGIGIDLCRYCKVNDNDVYSDYTGDAGICVTYRAKYTVNGTGPVDGNDLWGHHVWIFNNTCSMKGTLNSIGFQFAVHSDDVSNGTDGDSYYFANNLVYYLGNTTSTSTCFNTMNVNPSHLLFWDNNLCFYAPNTTVGDWMKAGTTAATTRYATRSLWNTAFPQFDAHSLSSDPKILNPATTGQIEATSPAAHTGSVSQGSRTDWRRCVRSTASPTPSIGAYEVGCPGGATLFSPTDVMASP